MTKYEVNYRPCGGRWSTNTDPHYCTGIYDKLEDALAAVTELYRDLLPHLAWFDVRITRINGSQTPGKK